MRIICDHGYYKFYPSKASDIYLYCDYYNINLVKVKDYYTFPLLVNALNYSLVGKSYLNAIANKTFEGQPWDVMAQNSFVFSLATSLLVPKQSITININPQLVGRYYLSDTPLIQAGSLDNLGNRITSYDAYYIQEAYQLKIVGLSYE